MPSFNTEVPNPFGQETAVQRLNGLLERVRERYKDQVSDLQESWENETLSFSFKSYGFTIGGRVKVEAEKILVHGEIPFAALPFRGRIEESIRGEIEKALA